MNTEDFKPYKNDIYAYTLVAKNSINLSGFQMPNLSAFISELSDYSLSDMVSNDKNIDFLEKLSSGQSILLEECTNFKNEESIVKIEKIFEKETSKEFYSELLKKTESEYSIIENFIIRDRREIAQYAKTLLNFPLTPEQFKNKYTEPKSLSYSITNSYADIFASGSLLRRMAVEDTSRISYETDLPLDVIAHDYIKTHAPYFKSFTEVLSAKNGSLIYFIFCPVFKINNTNIINYNESIKLAISLSDGRLKAFDASDYLKNHSKNNSFTDFLLPQIINNNSTINEYNEKYVYFGDKFYLQVSFSSNENNYYYLINQDNTSSKIYDEKEYFRTIEVI